jgi:hypothetical protein
MFDLDTAKTIKLFLGLSSDKVKRVVKSQLQ